MGFSFDGFVLRPPRTAPSNAVTTDEPETGVVRDFKPVPDLGQAIQGSEAPPLVDVAADQYRCSTLLRGDDGQTEYLVWAANTARLRDAGPFVERSAVVTFSEGALEVENLSGDPVTDGTLRALIRDKSSRSIAGLVSLEVRRGDTGTLFQLETSGSFNSVSGVFTLEDAGTIAALGGGFSETRGDRASVRYSVEGPAFWWSRNDRYETRFLWNGRTQRWEPLKGTPIRQLGRLLAEGSYSLAPVPQVPVGSFLPGSSQSLDEYAMLRVGSRPDALSTPVAEPVNPTTGLGGIKVVLDADFEEFDFAADPALTGVMAQSTGALAFNPQFVEEYAGQTLWYSYRGFLPTQTSPEPVGQLEGSDLNPLFIAPVPSPTDHPFIRIGNRTPLLPVLADTEALLSTLVINEGEVGVALSTGRLKFSPADVAKATPGDPAFDLAFLGKVVFYDGVSLTQQPVPLRAPTPLVNANGTPSKVGAKNVLYLPLAAPLPAPGTSGVLHLPDGTGTLPSLDTEPGIRPGGSSGLVRAVEGPWDLVLFADSGLIRDVRVVDDVDEIPRFEFKRPQGRAWINLNKGAGGSEVVLSREDRKRLRGETLYFLQAGVTPATFSSQARVYSRVRDTIELDGSEVFKFAINGSTYVWEASANHGGILTSAGGSFTVAEIATSLNAVVALSNGSVAALQGRLVIQSELIVNAKRIGTIEIGWGPGQERELKGPAALGFLPGWHLNIKAIPDSTEARYLPDSGTSLGVFRSPLNLDSSRDDINDLNHRARLEDFVLAESIPANSVTLLDRIPIEDEPGFDLDVFFRVDDGLSRRNQFNYKNLIHQFGEGKFSWADEASTFTTVEQPTNNLNLGRQRVLPDSMRIPGKGIFLSRQGEPFAPQALGEDFILPFEGAPGNAQLIRKFGTRVSLGGRASFTGGSRVVTVSDDVDFVTLGVGEGYLLKVLTGEAAGTYVVQAVLGMKQLEVRQPFSVSAGALAWELFEGIPDTALDEAIVADRTFTQFNHLKDEPFKIRLLSRVGDVPTDPNQRLDAVVGPALQSARPISLRFGLPHSSPTAILKGLEKHPLGTLANGLKVPETSSERFLSDAFSVQVGGKLYRFEDGNLVKAPALTPALAGDLVEIDSAGQLNFGADVFGQFQGAGVAYVQEFLDPFVLVQGEAEFDPHTGTLNLSAADQQDYVGETLYFVEQVVTEQGQDVTLSPLNGAFRFNRPLRTGQIVEAEYFQADAAGDLLLEPDTSFVAQSPGDTPPLVANRIIEFLPLFVRAELATKPAVAPNSILPSDYDRIWTFNPEQRTLREDIPPTIYAGNNLANVGGAASPVAEVVLGEVSQIRFKDPLPADTVVTITYGVLEATGGEETYSVSTIPVYRPPFYLESDTEEFTLEGDRTDDMVPGKFLRVAQFPFYLTSATFDGESTTIRFFPRTQTEAGSRAPGNDPLSLLSDGPIATQYNTDSPEGFWLQVEDPFEPINRGNTGFVFFGDHTKYAVAGHILEIGGYPFIVTGSRLSEDGARTEIGTTTPAPTGFAFGFDLARLSVRPIYPPNPRTFLGQGPVRPEDEIDLILFGEQDSKGTEKPGRSLRQSVDFAVDFDSGVVSLLSPNQDPLGPGQSLLLRHTRVETLAPVVEGGVLIPPRYLARYAHVTSPDSIGVQSKILKAQYTYAAPDTWYYRTVPLLDFLAEVADQVALGVTSTLPSRGSAPATVPAIQNEKQGQLGLKAQVVDLEHQDRAARVFLELYNEAILAFEQVRETITGDIIGDRDGKFRFFVGRNKEIAPPGYEDAISGTLNVRNVFSQLFLAGNLDLVHLTRDALVDPPTAQLDGDTIIGKFIDPDLFADYQRQQRDYIKNDIDDLVLVGRSRKKLRIFPILRLESFGQYQIMGQPHKFSRLFPERTSVFTLTDPGIGADLEAEPVDPGVYAFRKRVDRISFKGGINIPKRASTFKQAIAQLENPVLGQVSNVSRVNLQERLPRARVFAYSPVGFPELDPLGTDFGVNPRPAVIAVVLPLHQVPLRGDGLPDVVQLIANGGDLPDLSTGDPELFTPAFTVLSKGNSPQVAFGRPTGDILDVATSGSKSVSFGGGFAEAFDGTVLRKVFVGEVLLGCVVTFARDDGSFITSNDLLEVGDSSEIATPLALKRGDTLFVTPPDVDIEEQNGSLSDPPTAEETEAALQGLPGFRSGFDYRLDEADGEVLDFSFPSIRDPSVLPLKEILGQRPPKPLQNLEADIAFRNTGVEPVSIPALIGGVTNDSGDYSLPYLVAPNTEIERLGLAQTAFAEILSLDSPPIPDPEAVGAVFPDEILGNDGQSYLALTNGLAPTALHTSQDLTPVTTAGGYQAGSGIADARPFDLVLIQTASTGLPRGVQGIQTVGAVQGSLTSSTLELPRFVTPTLKGTRMRYRFENAITFVNKPVAGAPAGMVIERAGTLTTFDISSVSQGFLVLNGGSAAPIGGLNNIFDPGGLFAYPANANVVRLNLWTAATPGNPPVFLQSVEIDISGPSVSGDLGAQPLSAVPVALQQTLEVDTLLPFLTIALAPGPGEIPEDPLQPGRSVPLFFTIDIDCSAAGAASLTAAVLEDRLSFEESYDLRSVTPRTEPPMDGVPTASSLEILTVRGAGTDDLTVNSAAEVNGGVPFTFLAQADAYPFIGQFDFVPGIGVVKVQSLEGHGNLPLATSSPVTFTVLPSSAEDAEGSICAGTGECEAEGVVEDRGNRIALPVLNAGALSNVLPGDVLVIKSDDSGQATTKAGTYVIRHLIEPNDPFGGVHFREYAGLETKTQPINTSQGWLNVVFPRLVSIDRQGLVGKIFVDGGLALSDSSLAWPSNGRLYLCLDLTDISATVSVAYTSLNAIENSFVVDFADIQDHNGVVLPSTTLDNVPSDLVVSGFTRAEIRMDRAGVQLPRSVVGHQGTGATPWSAVEPPISGTALGLLGVLLKNDPEKHPSAAAGSEVFDYTVGGGPGTLATGEPPALNQIDVSKHVVPNNGILLSADVVVYDNVAAVLDLGSLSSATWNSIHGGVAGVAEEVNCIFPSDSLVIEDGLGRGFRAQAGIFLEPSMPTPIHDYADNGLTTTPRVVDAVSSLAAAQLGFRDGTLFGAASPEEVSFEVRRVRRWHTQQNKIEEALHPLRFVYKTRRGTVGSYSPHTITAGGTNLGDFDNPDVNINPGDLFRLLDEDGNLLDEVEIQGVLGPNQIALAAPGITAVSAGQVSGKSFEVYLRRVPVPHEQSNEQLLALITDQVLLDRRADLAQLQGGWVPVLSDPLEARQLWDTDPSIDFGALGIQPGDLLLIDPAGELQGPSGYPVTGRERGLRPFGDRSVPNRSVATTGQQVPFVPGGPGELDDNRGFYRITEVRKDRLIVSSETTFSGLGAAPVTFGSSAEYAVYPTVSGSEAPFADPPGGPGSEDQMALRPTAFAGTEGSPVNSFQGNAFSIAPVSYKVFRPSPLFSEEAIDLVLMHRERTLSWIEEISSFLEGRKSGTYQVFQQKAHATDLGTPLVPDDGLGVVSNALITGAGGETEISPFANTSDALSVLDRRFFVNDYRLDGEKPRVSTPDTPTYATLESNAGNPASEIGDGRPVLPDLIDDVLDNNDQLRPLRLSWISFRVNREEGVLVSIQNSVRTLAKRRARQIRQLLQTKGLKS